MDAREKDQAIAARIGARCQTLVLMSDVRTLRRASLTLHRWAEAECGDGSNFALERDEQTGKPYRRYIGPAATGAGRFRVPDREAGALRRIAAICERTGLHFYHQTDPRGCALYIAAEPLTDQNYFIAGVALCT